MEFIGNWDEIKARYAAYWEGEVLDRCVVAAYAPKKNGRRSDFPFPTNTEEQASWWLDGERVFERQWNSFENTYFGGDAFPCLILNTGTAGHIVMQRGLTCDFTSDSIWFNPVLHDIKTDEVVIDDNATLYRKTIELAKYLVAESAGRAVVSMPDSAGNLDGLAHLRGSEPLLVDMLDNPDWVHRNLATLQTAWERFNRETFDIIRENNDGGSAIGWLNTWAPCRHGQLQADISVMMSPALFNEFVMPELHVQSRFYDRALYHLDGAEQLRHLDMLLSVEGIDAIQWTPVAGQAPTSEHIPSLKKIQAAGKCLLLHTGSLSELELLLTELSSKGLMFLHYAPSEEEANAAVALTERLTHD